jgi:hypothetical protein
VPKTKNHARAVTPCGRFDKGSVLIRGTLANFLRFGSDYL